MSELIVNIFFHPLQISEDVIYVGLSGISAPCGSPPSLGRKETLGQQKVVRALGGRVGGGI